MLEIAKDYTLALEDVPNFKPEDLSKDQVVRLKHEITELLNKRNAVLVV